MRFLMWIFTIAFALAGITVRAAGGFYPDRPVEKGLFLLAFLACPFLWARPDGFMPDALAVPGKHRFALALALILSAPLILPWWR